jgi:uncharacterized membrane protein
VTQRTLLIALFASLALNLFVIGVAAGAYVFGDRLHHRRGEFRGPGNLMFAAAAGLPEAEAQGYREALSAQVMAERPKAHEARMARHDAWLRLGADPLDAASINADLDRARALESQARGEIDHRIVDFAAHLPATDRARLAQALATPPQRHGGPRRPPPGP